MPVSADFTRLVREAGSRGREVNELAFRLAYAELRRLAERHLRRERSGHTLSPTGLVHQAFLRLADHTQVTWQDRQHFFCIAATTMRRILINHARDRKALKRGGDAPHVPIDGVLGLSAPEPEDLMLALDEALEALAAFDDRKRQIVELRYFAGLTEEETAEVLGLSRATVQRHWYAARAWLFNRLREETDDAGLAA